MCCAQGVREIDLAVKAICLGLPALSHLHLPYHSNSNAAAVENITRHLGDRLTFLRLSVRDPLSHSLALHFSALQSLHIHAGLAWPALLHMSDFTHLLPCLSELSISVYGDDDDDPGPPGAAAAVMSPLPPSLTYLQIVWINSLLPVTNPVKLPPALASSLRCLSLTLPGTALTDNLLSSIPAHSPHLTHCHVDYADHLNNAGGMIQLQQRLWGLRDRLGAAVWCENASAVEQQRLDRRWQRKMGVKVWE